MFITSDSDKTCDVVQGGSGRAGYDGVSPIGGPMPTVATQPASAKPGATSTRELLGADGESLLTYKAKVDKAMLHLPGPDFVDRVWAGSDRNPQVLRSIQTMYGHGRLGGTGYMSILPVDQGIEHSAGAS